MLSGGGGEWKFYKNKNYRMGVSTVQYFYHIIQYVEVNINIFLDFFYDHLA